MVNLGRAQGWLSTKGKKGLGVSQGKHRRGENFLSKASFNYQWQLHNEIVVGYLLQWLGIERFLSPCLAMPWPVLQGGKDQFGVCKVVNVNLELARC